MTEPKKVLKCSRRGPKFCFAMEPRLLGVNGREPGFHMMQVMNWKTQKLKVIGIAYRTSRKASDKGLMLNVCPWCHSNLAWFRKKGEKP